MAFSRSINENNNGSSSSGANSSNAEYPSSASSSAYSVTRKTSVLLFQMDQILSSLFLECVFPITAYYIFCGYILTNDDDGDNDDEFCQRRRRRRRQILQKRYQKLEYLINFLPNKIINFWKNNISGLVNYEDEKKAPASSSGKKGIISYMPSSSILIATVALGYHLLSPFVVPQFGYRHHRVIGGGCSSTGGTVYYSAGYYGGFGWRWLFYYPFILSFLSDNNASVDEDEENSNNDDTEGNRSEKNENKEKPEEKNLARAIITPAMEAERPAQPVTLISSPEKPQHVSIQATATTTRDRSESITTRSRSNSINARSRSESISSAAPPPPPPPQRYLEMLVHNVAHTDLVLSLAPQSPLPTPPPTTPRKTNVTEDSYDDKCLCRPRFSTFDMFSRRVLQMMLQKHSDPASLENIVINYPRYERNVFSPRFSIVAPSRNKNSGQLLLLPAGFDLSSLHEGKKNKEEEDLLKVNPKELPNLRVRGRDVAKLGKVCEDMMHSYLFNGDDKSDDSSGEKKEEKESRDLYLNAIFFPLLATLLPRWTRQISSKFKSTPSHLKKVVILVSGVGTPRNWTHSITGNSTQALAELMEMFITVLYPDVTVVKIHSDTNIFRYDENISFVKRELMPRIDAYRDAHARNEPYPDEINQNITIKRSTNPFNPDWKNSFAVTLSFADGSPARTHAIQASLRPYKPTYFHFWQLKTFWHESKICDDDIEVHSFEDMETVPAMEVTKISSESVQMVVEEMKKFRTHFLETLKGEEGGNDIRSFWLRKTKKPVLAVLLVEKQNDGDDVSKPILYRGTNMEVSMPTGSLCAERNVIGTALASDPSLKREDLKMVAVLAVPLPPPPPPSPPPPMDGLGTAADGLSYCQPISSSGMGGSPKDASAPASAVEGHAFLTEVEQKLEQHRPESMRRSMSVTSCASIAELAEEEEKDDENDNGEVIIPAGDTSNVHNAVDLSSSWVMADQQKKQEGEEDNALSSSSSHIITVPRSSPKFSPSLMSIGSGSGLPPPVVPSLNLSQVPSSHVVNAPPAITAVLSEGSPKPPGTPMRMIKLYTDDDAGSVAEDDFAHNVAVVGKAAGNSGSVGINDGKSGADAGIKEKSGASSGKPPLTSTGRRKQKRTVVVHSSTEDLNPLRPCGACNEWLKKIAEVSIDFKVLTFTDADCNGVYVSSCQE